MRCSPSAIARSSGCSTSCSPRCSLGSLALTLYASWLSARIRRLRDEAERAIDAQGRVHGPLTSSNAGDEIGDLSRSFSSVLARLSQYASYQENMASRLSHELRTPIAVVRSLARQPEARAAAGTTRASTSSARRMASTD